MKARFVSDDMLVGILIGAVVVALAVAITVLAVTF